MSRRVRQKAGPGRLKSLAGIGAAALLFAAAGAWHYFDTLAGAAASGDPWLSENYLALFAALAVFLAGAAVLLLGKRQKLEFCYLFCVLVLGGAYMFVLPPLSAPDEISHFAGAYELSNAMMGRRSGGGEDGYVVFRLEDDFLQNIYGASGDEERISLGRTLDEETYSLLHGRGIGLSRVDGERVSVRTPVSTTPLAYLPQALGITAARLLRLNNVALAYLGRFCNLALFALLGFLSIRVLPFGKEIFFGVSLLPMTLHLAASYSYDVFVMGLGFLFASYSLYLAYEKPEVERRDVAVLAFIMAALGPCKMIYAVVMGFALLIPAEKFGKRGRRALAALAVLAAFAAAMLLVNGRTIAVYISGADNVVSWAGEEGYSIPLILHKPLLYVRMLYETALSLADEWFFTMMGANLGNLDPVLNVPFVVVAGMTASLFALGVRRAGETLYLGGKAKAWILTLFALCLLALMTAMLVAWTPLSSRVIDGVQGRYLLPLLPFALMTLKSGGLVRTEGDDGKILFCLCAMNGYVLLRLFSIVSMRV